MRHALYTIIFVVCLFSSTSCAQRSIYETVWRAEEYFTDPQMVALCKAIGKEDIPKMLVAISNAAIRALGVEPALSHNVFATIIPLEHF